MKYYYYKVTKTGGYPHGVFWINKTKKRIKDDIMPPYIQIYITGIFNTSSVKDINAKLWYESYNWKNQNYTVEELTEEDLFPYFL